jgi:hypothetical protein
MGGVAGSELKFAAKKAATWGTPVAVGALDGFMSLPTGIKRQADVIIDDSLGNYFVTGATPGAVKVDGDIPLYLRYEGCDLLLAMFMGPAGVPATHAAGTLSKDYVYKWLTSTDGLFVTFVKHMKNYIAETPSLKITGLTIKGEAGKPLQMIVNASGNDVVTNSATNTTVLFTSNVTFPSDATTNRVSFGQGVIRMNSQSGIALAAGDTIYPSSFELTAKRKMSGVLGQYKTTAFAGNVQDCIDEPTNDGQPEVTLKLQFPRHTAVTRLNDLGNDNRFKADMTFTGTLIEGAIYRSMLFQFPHLMMKSVDVQDEAGIIKEPVEFLVLPALAAPTGMTGITDPFWISGVNKRTTNPLA